MIRTAEQLAKMPEGEHKCITIRTAMPGDVKFLDHLQSKYSHQLGYLPLQALEANIERGNVSLALENDDPAAYLLGKGSYLRDPHFGIMYQAAVSYDARRRLVGTALVQYFIDHLEPAVRLIGLWCAQDIDANEFWNACGFEAIAARHGSRRKGRVHIFWVGRTPRGRHEPLRYPRYTHGGLMREHREVFGLKPGEEYTEVVLPPPEASDAPPRADGSRCAKGAGRKASGSARTLKMSLIEQQRAFRYGHGKHICVVVAGVTKYLPVAPFDMPNFSDLAKVMVSCPRVSSSPRPKGVVTGGRRLVSDGHLWTPALGVESPEAKAA